MANKGNLRDGDDKQKRDSHTPQKWKKGWNNPVNRALGVTPEDIVANEQGRLTSKQSRRLLPFFFGRLAICIFGLSLGGILLAALTESWRSFEEGLCWMLLFIGTFLYGGLLAARTAYEIGKDISNPHVYTSTSRVEKHAEEYHTMYGGSGYRYYIRIVRGSTPFSSTYMFVRISKQLFDAFSEGNTYTVYYTPTDHRIVAAVRESED